MAAQFAALALFTMLQMTIINPENNRARSPVPPQNMPLDDIPMFVTITFDDALSEQANIDTEKIINHKNRNNEQIPLIYFVSNQYSDYAYIQNRYLQGCEIAVHTVTHTTATTSDTNKWFHEIKQCRELLATHADIPTQNLIGFRAPFLQKSDITFQVLHGLGFGYDSTVISKLDNALFDWPYTLDAYDNERVYDVGQGPQASYPGFWELPMYTIYGNILTQQPLNSGMYSSIMDYASGDNDGPILDILKSNFEYRLNTNKAPMGLYFHTSWLEEAANVEALNQFIQWVLGMEHTWFVTNQEIIAWINNPIPSGEYTFVNSNRLQNNKRSFRICEYASGYFHTVQDECPSVMPHTMEYDPSALIHAEISIVSTEDNYVILEQDLCTEDSYVSFDPETIYCADIINSDVREVVRYNNVLYQCAWWINESLPNAGGAWKFLENCEGQSLTFIKGSITPYGDVTVWEDSVLQIAVEFNCGYALDFSAMAQYLSKAFPSGNYELSMSEDKSGADLVINFGAIEYSEYEIVFSFTEVTSAVCAPTVQLTSSPAFEFPTITTEEYLRQLSAMVPRTALPTMAPATASAASNNVDAKDEYTRARSFSLTYIIGYVALIIFSLFLTMNVYVHVR